MNYQGLNKTKSLKLFHCCHSEHTLFVAHRAVYCPVEIGILSASDTGHGHPLWRTDKDFLIPLRKDFLHEGTPNC